MGRPAGFAQQRCTLPFAPVDELLQRFKINDKQVARGMLREGGVFESHLRALSRARSTGRVTEEFADRVCVAVGRHPAEVYGAAWWEDPEEVARAV